MDLSDISQVLGADDIFTSWLEISENYHGENADRFSLELLHVIVNAHDSQIFKITNGYRYQQKQEKQGSFDESL